MKHFLLYTALRIAIFVATYAVLVTIAVLLGADRSAFIWLLLGAAVISAAISLKLLTRQREQLALSVQQRAERAAARFEEMKAAEDED